MYIYIYIYIAINNIYIYICIHIYGGACRFAARAAPEPYLPYFTLSANSVKEMFPFQACKTTKNSPKSVSEGGRIWQVWILAIFYPFSQFCEIDVSLPSL